MKKKEPEPVEDPKIRKPDFFHAGRPVYRCHQGCGDRYEMIEDLPGILKHEATEHAPQERVSSILAPDGNPAKIAE